MKIMTSWKKMLVDGKRFITRDELEDICDAIGKDYGTVVHYLLVHRYLVRIFKGVFYVRDPDEMERGYYKLSVYEMVAKALELKGVKNWYLALETALTLNTMTHEYFRVNFVVTDSRRTTKAIRILDTEFRFLRWGPGLFDFGVQRMNGLRVSDKEKTLLDLVYRRYVNKKRKGTGSDLDLMAKDLLGEYGQSIDIKKLESYIPRYPLRMGNKIWQAIEESSLRG